MSALPRRAVLAGSAALPLFAIRTRPANAAEFSYKMANNTPVTHPLTVRQQEAANRIKQATNGRLDIQLFPNNDQGWDAPELVYVTESPLEAIAATVKLVL